MTHETTLRAAVEHIEAARFGPALDVLCDLWTSFRPAELGGIIEDLGNLYGSATVFEGYAGYLEARQLLVDPSGAARSAAFVFIKKNPDRIFGMLSTVGDRPPPDPRFCRLFLYWHNDPPDRNAPFFREVVPLIRNDVDPGVLHQLQGALASDHLPQTSQRALQGRIRRAIARTPPADQPTAAEQAALDALRFMVDAMLESDAPTFEDQFVRPLDEEKLSIWADGLLAEGDARGEFVQLQLQDARGELNRTGRRRMKALLAEHGSEWLGCFGTSLKASACAFRMGVAYRLAVTHQQLTPCPELDAVEEVVLTQESHAALLTPGLRPRRVEGIRTLAALEIALSLGATEIATGEPFLDLYTDWLDEPLPDPVDLDVLEIVGLKFQGEIVAQHLRSAFDGRVKTLVVRVRKREQADMQRELERWSVEDKRLELS